MFDVDWIDPGRETVGQRRNRKDQEANGLSRASSIKSSKSSDSTPSQPQPPIFGFFGSKKKSLLKRAASNSKLPAQGTEQNNTASRRLSTYTAVSEFSVAERPKTAATTTGRNSDDAQNADVFFSGPLYNSGSDRSDYSDGKNLDFILHSKLIFQNPSSLDGQAVVQQRNQPGVLFRLLRPSQFPVNLKFEATSCRNSVKIRL
jgi:hypothetical protein